MLKNKTNIIPADELKPIIEQMILDPRLVGLAKYIVGINFYWSDSISTACAGHGYIFFNQKFFYSLPEETRITIIVHEIEHLILRHLERGKECNPTIHNQAADHVINNLLKEEGFTFDGISFEICCDPKYKGMSTETVYNILMQNLKNNPPPFPQQGQASSDQIEDLIKEALNGKSSLKDQMKKAEKSLKELEGSIGNESGHKLIELNNTNTNVIIENATYPEIFKDYLIEPLGQTRRTFGRINRRQHGTKINHNFRLPGKINRSTKLNRLTHLVYALDVSGSISKEQAQQFHDSVRTIKDLLNPTKLTILFFDTKIKLQKTFSDKESYKDIKVKAGGGTSLKNVYEKVEQLSPEALVIFTDMQVSIPPKPKCDILWFIPFRVYKVAPYGKTYLIPSK